MPVEDALGTVLVTGGSSGLGAAVAAAVDAEGGTPVVLDLQPPPDGFAFRQVDVVRVRMGPHRVDCEPLVRMPEPGQLVAVAFPLPQEPEDGEVKHLSRVRCIDPMHR